MPWYKTGTVKTTINSNAIIGTGTAFISNSRVGDAFRGPDGGWYEVVNIASDTAMSISPNYQGPTVAAGTYSLAPMQGYVKESADALRGITNTYGTKLAALGTTGNYDILPVAKGGTGGTTQASARTALGLGTAATANVTTSTSSGAYGQVLKFGDFGIGGTAPYLSNLDLNSFSSSGGFFYVISPVNGPVPYDGWLINSPVDTNTCSQIFIVVNTRDTYLRIKSSGSWLAWEMLVNNRNAVTDPGLNAGGIVFSGSNANGSFTKFADGTLICKFTSSTSVAMAGAAGNVWQSASSAFTFPSIFTSPPSVTPTTTESVNSICWSAILGAISVSSVSIGAQAPISGANTKLGYIAVGRWKA